MVEKVLLVDDERDFLEAMAERMRARGMEVTTTTSTRDALKKTEKENYDAIVMDLMMPEMQGMEALKALKEKKPALQIILLTGYATQEKGAEALKLGAFDLIEKPADLKVLTEKIKLAHAQKRLIEKKRKRKSVKKSTRRKSPRKEKLN
jgi:DNA-binding NtrC family response regulator